ncbi:MAG: hypothetical protein JWP89_1322 [Schlesneria sp.]|nr:hypothetical protein [Schlesneria sp.]
MLRSQIDSGVSRYTNLRCGISIVEFLICVVVVALLVAVGVPAIQNARQSARTSQCRQRLAQIGMGLDGYHAAHGKFPAAAVWKPGPLSSLALHATKRIDIVTYDNWALSLLPYLDQTAIANQWNQDLPIADPANRSVRTASPTVFSCPVDSFNRPDNPYRFTISESSAPPIEFARGNFGFNGGTNGNRADDGSTSAPPGDRSTLILDEERGEFRYLGNGIGGINWPLSRDELKNGLSTMIVIDELRAGIDPLDPRGVWSFGQIGGSITWAHGINGDDFAPNNQWPRADDVQGCGELHRHLGTKAIMDARMPCVDYVDANQQATARSQHAGGIHALFADGRVRFISDAIDPGLWHVLHSRETPAEVLSKGPDVLLSITNDRNDAAASRALEWPDDAPESIRNSLQMEFVLIPAGEFEMGVPDVGFGPALADTTPHPVRITRPYFLGKTEVTQRQFEAIMASNPSYHTPATTEEESTAEFPVEQVTWNEADDFCRRLSETATERAAGRIYRLPTEAEWEYACRAGVREPHKLPERRIATTGEAAGVQPAFPVGPVGAFPANPFGLHDMRGNVWEWCRDRFDRDYYARSPVADPQGPATGFLKVIRGSDWIFVGEKCMINYPIMPPWKHSAFVGFRVICERTVPAK